MKKILSSAMIGFLSSMTFSQVTDTGNRVGIGESTPQTKLHINVINANSEILRLDNAGLRATSFTNYSDGTYDNVGIQFKKSSSEGQFKFSNLNGDLLTILSDGKINISNTNPNTELLRLGNAELRTTSFINYSDGTYDNAGLQFKKNSTAGQFKFSNLNGDLLTILSDGDVGIGTTNPKGWKLAVNGKIRAKEIKVETGWSDFVFEKDYYLPTLKEVEEHIKDKGHLKDIPSTKEVKKNGIFLGQMDSKLLLKIEELTLYTIQQEKKIEELERKNEQLVILNEKLLELQKRMEILEKK
ncbi:hypothetical protein LV716_15950 [Flagellimonas sp. HMM57]|uniref:hypothetical protein n=1 Tax=unclassified Flagellimonas TaxID=2644544 RepID=UPI0013D48A19|nr:MULTISPECIES: hypothetical protein [unclassified Flagellimonas]UII75734.1 hypothetical protein LV716_15950 [Flagellimonas sp. HMM57]